MKKKEKKKRKRDKRGWILCSAQRKDDGFHMMILNSVCLIQFVICLSVERCYSNGKWIGGQRNVNE